ncbi:MAG TPA: HEAT repeat domain-containing protein, partial [Oceanobacillus sp.]|nr:HEAT repeat domain-containing protein [Oceanobacillus sp.]
DKTAGQSDRIAAILALEAIRDDRAVPVLMSIIQDQDDSPIIRGEAEERLSFFHAPEAVSLYITALQDKSADVRFWAAYGLRCTADERDISAALHLLDHVVAFDEESPQGWWHVGREAMSALGCLWYPQETTDKAGRHYVVTQTYLISPLLEYADFQRASWQREGEERRWQPLQQSTTLRLDPAWLSDQLKQQWQGIRFNVIEPQPQSLILNWEIDMPNGLLLGGLHRDGYGIMLTNRSYDDVLDFAVWYRSIISPEHPLRLYEWADSGRELRPGMTVDELKG